MDLIDRQQAIDSLKELTANGTNKGMVFGKDAVHRIEMLPSAQPKLLQPWEVLVAQSVLSQPEIIHCGDCKYKDDGIDEDGIPFLKCLHGRSYGGTRINDFCSWAERRQYEL